MPLKTKMYDLSFAFIIVSFITADNDCLPVSINAETYLPAIKFKSVALLTTACTTTDLF